MAVEHLTKSYGARRGVVDLTFSVAAGEVCHSMHWAAIEVTR